MSQHPMLVATPQKPRVYTEDEWEGKRTTFQELYSKDYTLDEVMKLMVENHGFSATKAQYKKKIKAWGLERNIDKKTALGILRKESKRKYVEDKDTQFTYKNNEISADRIALLRKRHKGSDHENLGSDPRQWEMVQADTPPFITYSTPAPVDEPPFISYSPAPMNELSEVEFDMTDYPPHDPHIINDEGFHSGEILTDDIDFVTDEIHKQVEATPPDQQTQSQMPFNISSSTPRQDLQGQPIGTDSSSDDGNDIIDLDVDLRSNELSIFQLAAHSHRNRPENGSKFISLHDAAYEGLEDIVILLLKQGHNVSEKDIEARTALHRAAAGGHGRVVQLLLESDIDVSAKSQWGITALHMAASGGHEKVVQLLLKSGIDVSAKGGWKEETALHMAARGGHEKVVQLLLESDIDVSAKSHWGITALHMAASGGYEKVVQLLLKSGIDVSAKDWWDKETALHMAARGGHEKVVQLLLESDIDVSARSQVGETALHMAASGGYEKVVQLLLESGIDVSVIAQGRITALHMAARGGHEKVFRLLLKSGIDVTIRNKDGETALDYMYAKR